ncbi:hypothetical protein [Mycolicibacterium chitae]|nr:hypothetical protein [Mycolicibacterium chitae]
MTAITTPAADGSTIDSASCQPAGFLASRIRAVCAPTRTVR